MRRFLTSILVSLPICVILVSLSASAQIARRQADVSVTAVNYPVTITFPTAPQAHDLLFLAVSTYSGATVAPTGSGWTLLLHQSANNWQQLVYWHAVTAGEANSYPVTNDNQSELKMMDLEGTAFYGPIDAVVSAAPASSGTSYTTPAATGTVTGDLPIAVLSTDDVTGASVASPWTGAFSAQPHPLSLAIGPLTTDTTTAQSATFTLSAASTGGFGAATILVKPYSATPIAPVADSGSGYSGILPNTIPFDASASSDPKQETLAYAWTFGDGATGTGINPSHSYTAIGRYTAAVTVTNTDGLSSSASTTVVIQQDPHCITGRGNNTQVDLSCFSVSPADEWHHDAISDPTDPNSAADLNSIGSSFLHPDFGDPANNAGGIPFYVVDTTPTATSPQPLVPWQHNPQQTPNNGLSADYTYFSDLTLYPININSPIEDLPADCTYTDQGDTHVITFDVNGAKVYELDQARRCPTNTPVWTASSGAVFDGTRSNWRRPYTYTSADAGGRSIFEGLARPDEVRAVLASTACINDSTKCYLNHALRFTVATPQCYDDLNGDGQGAFQAPMVHSAGCGGNLKDNPTQGGIIYGDRLVLDSTFDVSSFDPVSRVLAQTIMHYGLMMADVGSNLYVSGTPDPWWNDDLLHTYFASIPKSRLRVVQRKQVLASGHYPSGQEPVIDTFTASPGTVAAGQCSTITWAIRYASYAYIEEIGLLSATSGSMQWCPAASTDLTLVASSLYLANDDGYGNGHRPQAMSEIVVQPAAAPKLPFFWGR